MKRAQGWIIAGGLIALAGLGVFNPLFAAVFGTVVPMFELEVAELFVYGTDLALLQAVAALAGVAVALAGAGYVLRSPQRLAAPALALGASVLTATLYAHATAATRVAQATGGLVAGERVLALEGPYLVYLGALMIVGGALGLLAAPPVLAAGERLLRVAVAWRGNILREELVVRPRDVVLGGATKDALPAPAALSGSPDRWTLFRRDATGQYELALAQGMGGHLELGDRRRQVGDLLPETATTRPTYLPVEPGDRGTITLGELAVFFEFVVPPSLPRPRLLANLSADFAAATLFSAVAQVGLIVVALLLWEETAVRAKPTDQLKVFTASVKLQEAIPDEPLPLEDETGADSKRAEGEEGRFGDPDVPPEIESRVPRRDGEVAQRIDPRKTGLNDLLSSSRLGGHNAISHILQRDSEGFQNRLAVAMAGTGTELVMGHGSGGLSFRGTGPGGGGPDGYGRIHGLGRIDTESGRDIRVGRERRRERRVGEVSSPGGATQGFCARGDIAKNVRLRAAAVRACYERALQTRPKLAGKITVRWTIALDGKVQGATVAGATLADRKVQSCILRAIRRIRFTAPKGGICVVNWPFVFQPG